MSESSAVCLFGEGKGRELICDGRRTKRTRSLIVGRKMGKKEETTENTACCSGGVAGMTRRGC